jgi:glyoxylase-like metal-dependent hydrolase (beta-lactamase superfamily II)
VQPDFPLQGNVPPQNSSSNQRPTALKPPRLVLDHIFAFPPNRETLGGTAYLIVENAANILIDCPAWNETNEQFLREKGGVSSLLITHRGAIGRVREIQESTGCKILIQEQEAYLLPGLDVTSFQDYILTPSGTAIWTPGHSPGSACFYYQSLEGGVLFSGRHLLPNPKGELLPLRTPKTFHWTRQLKSVQSLLERFTPTTLQFICPGANIGFLRGKGFVDGVYERLEMLDLAAIS